MKTVTGHDIPPKMLCNYLSTLVNQFFKILPIKESGEPSLNEFIHSLQAELLGCHSLIEAINGDSMFLSLVSILQYLLDNECEIKVVKREVFKAISVCKKLQEKYFPKGVA